MKTMSRILVATLMLSGLVGCGTWSPSNWGLFGSKENKTVVLIEAESLASETGGKVLVRGDRPATSGGQLFSGWDDKDHAIEWSVDVPQSGLYRVALRYAGGRAWNVLRDLKIDGKYPDAAFSSIALPSTGGFGTRPDQWKNLVVSDAAGKPALVRLEAGKHVIRMNNLGGVGNDSKGNPNGGSGNLDAIILVGEHADLAATLAPLGAAPAKAK